MSDFNSILTSTKKLMGINPEYTHFDADLTIHINTTFMILHQMGVGPTEPFSITGNGESWDDFLTGDDSLEGVKTYVYLKCRLVFDPPASSVLVEAINRTIKELEWRLANAPSTINR